MKKNLHITSRVRQNNKPRRVQQPLLKLTLSHRYLISSNPLEKRRNWMVLTKRRAFIDQFCPSCQKRIDVWVKYILSYLSQLTHKTLITYTPTYPLHSPH
ncbi:unnamed protein product [Hymenolepis diminuta]|uniref:Uncharacterized protein n=1 Tax=Hymenolepis diminuta TaxID=6216 RepID=A0A564YEF4_HYMDI|nr:unnamed protein product [Hymenolepis diminuta]